MPWIRCERYGILVSKKNLFWETCALAFEKRELAEAVLGTNIASD